KDGVSKSKVAMAMMNLQETENETNSNTTKVLQSKFVLKKLPVDIEYQSSSEIKLKENPKFGVEKLEWSPNSRFLAFVNDNMAKYVWIWDMKCLCLHSVLKHLSPVLQLLWTGNEHSSNQLASCCNQRDQLYLWNKKGAVVIRVLASRFVVRQMYAQPNNECICLVDNGHFCCCYDFNFE
ncbi:hypothetical protein RFI_31494, partial [Reticulomyxa filosa]